MRSDESVPSRKAFDTERLCLFRLCEFVDTLATDANSLTYFLPNAPSQAKQVEAELSLRLFVIHRLRNFDTILHLLSFVQLSFFILYGLLFCQSQLNGLRIVFRTNTTRPSTMVSLCATRFADVKFLHCCFSIVFPISIECVRPFVQCTR